MKKVLLTTVCGPFGVDTNDCSRHLMPEFFMTSSLRHGALKNCRDSKLSAMAADDIVKAGFKNVINLVGGLEGSSSGWKKANLPLNYMFFIKDLDPRYIYPPDISNIHSRKGEK